MDFEQRYDAEYEEFQREVKRWLDANAPSDGPVSAGTGPLPSHIEELRRQFLAKLSDRGWAAPSLPAEYGGAGLTATHELIVRRELEARNLAAPYAANRSVASAVLAWGSDEQKSKYIRDLLRGNLVVSKPFYETYAVAYPEGVRAAAKRDGDSYVLTADEMFVGACGMPTHLWAIALTDPEAPPHKRLSVFLLPSDLQGVSISTLDSIAGDTKLVVNMDEVLVPVEYRIGDEGDGSLVAHSALGTEAEADRVLKEHATMVTALIRYCKDKAINQLPQEQYRRMREMVAEAYINTQILRLISARNEWMRTSGQELTFHESQYAMLAKLMRPRLSDIMLDNMGPLALVSDEQWDVSDGASESFQRSSIPGLSVDDSDDTHERIITRYIQHRED